MHTIAGGLDVRIAVIGMVGLVITGACLCMPVESVQAAELSFLWTQYPSAFNSSTWTVYPKSSTTPVASHAIEVWNDSSSFDFYTASTGLIKYARTNDFSDIDNWTGTPSTEYSTHWGWMPPENATITGVFVVANFYESCPRMQFAVSTNNASSWSSSAIISEDFDYYAEWGTWSWNITSLLAWTPAMLNSTSLWAQLKVWPTASTHYYLDYLGFSVWWWDDSGLGGSGVDDGITPTPEDEGGLPSDIDYSFIYDAGGIIGIMGVIGFIGMIAAPAIGVYVAKQGTESKMALFVKMLALWMFCMTMFMVAVNA